DLPTAAGAAADFGEGKGVGLTHEGLAGAEPGNDGARVSRVAAPVEHGPLDDFLELHRAAEPGNVRVGGGHRRYVVVAAVRGEERVCVFARRAGGLAVGC